MTCFAKMFKKEEPKENKTLQVLLKVFLIVGIVAGVCVILKFLFDKYRKDLSCICDDDFDCDDLFEDDDSDCGCIGDECEAAPAEEADKADETGAE